MSLCYCVSVVSESGNILNYTDCSGTTVYEEVAPYENIIICSIDGLVSGSSIGPINTTILGQCVDGVCVTATTTSTSTTTTTTKQYLSMIPKNECDVITIFPMGVDCLVQNPSSDKSFDGLATLIITGGTPPYTISWDVGSFAPALSNLGVGEYSATVVDYYGDFTANTTCVLTAETQTISGMCFVLTGVVENELIYISTESIGLKNGKPHYFLQYGIQSLGYVFWDTTHESWIFCQTLDCQTTPYNVLDNNDAEFYPTANLGNWIISDNNIHFLIQESYIGPCEIPVPPIEEYDLCVTLEVLNNTYDVPTIDTIQIELLPSELINNQPSWTSNTGSYLLYWNTGSTPSQWTLTGYSPTTILISNDPSYPPLSNWQILGDPSVHGMFVTTGNCATGYTVSVTATKNDANCGVHGSITVSAAGGVSPYSFSINGGSTYQPSPIFNNLLPGVYSVTAKDSNNVVGTFGNITINSIPPTTYNLTLNVNYSNNTFSITAPILPIGVTLNVDLVMNSNFQYYPTSLSPVPTYDNLTTIDGLYNMNFVNIVTNSIPVTGPCTLIGVVNATQIQKTYTSTLTFTSNQTITGSTTNTIINNPVGLCRVASGSYTLAIVNPVVSNCSCCNLILDTKTTNPAVLPA